ncbi:proteasome subunit beta type-4 [Melanaphis sacchari]|uniref:Proteasome subunit beta n=1 Tax=Melanaphis sacchari TaxID=742174 RepID=A0A2H8TRK9_9HEMI|nr:proteasome subunit beta type-4 [Melanaphis sacchari]
MDIKHNNWIPGNFKSVPNTGHTAHDIVQHGWTPITTTTSVLGVVFDSGVALAADTLTSYGSMACFQNNPRILTVNQNIIVAAAGEYSDYQFIRDVVEDKVRTEKSLNDGISMKPKALHTWLSRVLYNRRTKMKPLWSTFLVAGIQNDVPFLGEIDKLGTAFIDDQIASGYGAYLALPLMRKAIDEKREKFNSKLTKDEAINLLKNCMEVLYYRDARSHDKYQIGIITKDSVEVQNLVLKPRWEIAKLVQGYE